MSGAPEALRLADSLELCWGDSRLDEAAAELRRLHAENERLAALVEAQQPATCGNTPYDEGPFTLAQQPAPSAAAAGDSGDLCRAIDAAKTHLSNARSSYFLKDMHRKAVSELSQAALALAQAKVLAQPSPTPQADSQPAPDQRQQLDAYYSLLDAMGWESKRQHISPETWAADLLRDATAYRAARAPADSVTAPAGGVVARVLLDSAGKPMLRPQLLDEEFLADPEAFDLMYPHRAPHRIADLYATPPQAADSVLEDAARLWDAFVEAWRNELGVDKIVNIMGGADKLKAVFLDAARKQGANHD